jgi:UDP:flavonoid glycosyltransferase YjiC (YdhE family)
MLALALALRARGHVASFLAPANSVEWIRTHGFEAMSDGVDVEAMLQSPDNDLQGLRWQVRYFRETLLPQLFETVRQASADEDLIIASGVQIAASSAAERRGIPYVGVAFCPCAIPNDAAPPASVKTQTLPRWMNRLLWTAGRPVVDYALRDAFNAGRAQLGLPPVRSPIASLAGRAILLAADRDLAPIGQGAPVHVTTTDAWVLHDSTALSDEVEAFLNAGAPPIYAGFGSMVAKDTVALASHVVAAARAAGRRAIIAGGWASLGDRIGRLDDVLVIRSAPHAAPFPRVAAVIHHGGAGTTTAAAGAGVPQVILPHILDQYYWANRIVTLGLGPRALPVSRVTEQALTGHVRSAVNEAAYRERAAQLGPTIAARNGVDAAVDRLEEIARRPM